MKELYLALCSNSGVCVFSSFYFSFEFEFVSVFVFVFCKRKRNIWITELAQPQRMSTIYERFTSFLESCFFTLACQMEPNKHIFLQKFQMYTMYNSHLIFARSWLKRDGGERARVYHRKDEWRIVRSGNNWAYTIFTQYADIHKIASGSHAMCCWIV